VFNYITILIFIPWNFSLSYKSCVLQRIHLLNVFQYYYSAHARNFLDVCCILVTKMYLICKWQ
jgi:hypothetical protein